MTAMNFRDFRVRPAVPGDFPQLLPMLLDMGFVDSEEALAARFPSFCGRADSPVWVAEAAGTAGPGGLLGYAYAQDYGPHLRPGVGHRTAKLNDLYTLPHARGRGVGRALMGQAEVWAQERGIRYLFWYANTREASPAYTAMGYRAAPSGEEAYHFFEVDFGEGEPRTPHAERGS